MFLDIVFQSGEFYTHSSSSFWIGLIGALIGAGTTVGIFFLKILIDNKNAVKYLTVLMESIIKNTDSQIEKYKEHSESLRTLPFEFHLVPKVISNDIIRFTSTLDNERLFHAYISQFGGKKETIRNFKQIVNCSDFIFEINNQAYKAGETNLSNHHEKMLKYKDITEEKIMNTCSLICNDFAVKGQRENPFFIALNNAITNYFDIKPNPITAEYIQIGFITPLTKTLSDNFRGLTQGMELLDWCRKANWVYAEIVDNSNATADEFEEFTRQLNEAINSIKTATINLKPFSSN